MPHFNLDRYHERLGNFPGILMTKTRDSLRLRQPFFLVIATRPAGIGGIERVTRDMIRVLSDRYGQESVGLVATSGEGPFTDIPCMFIRRGDTEAERSPRVGASTKLAMLLASVSAGFRYRHRRLVVISCHPRLAPIGWLCSIAGRGSHLVWSYGVESWTRLALIPRYAVTRATQVLAISSYTADHVSDLNGIPMDRVRVVHLPVSKEITDAADVSPASPDHARPTLLSVCRLDASEQLKGVDTVIRALPGIAASCPTVRYAVIGDGDDRPRLEQLAKDTGVGDRVEFTGPVTDSVVVERYRTCDVFVMPSAQEGFGLVFAEAMTFGKPAIGADFGGTTDVISDGETGYLVPYGDVDALAARITGLLLNDDLRARIGEAAKRDALTRFSSDAFDRAVLDVMESLL